MFESAVLQVAPGQRARSAVVLPLAVLTHFAVVATVLTVQLLTVDELRPPLERITEVFLPPARPPAEGPAPQHRGADSQPQHRQQAVQPSAVPDSVPAAPDHAEPAPGQGVPYGVGEPGAGAGGGGGEGSGSDAAPEPEPAGPQAPAILTIGGEVLAPVIVSRVMPVYPAIAKTAGKQGTVLVRAVVDTEGNVAGAVVLRDGVGLGCGEAAVAAIRAWRFRPATMRGRPVSVFMEITVAFTLSRG
jgi:periplasmic protein TonB